MVRRKRRIKPSSNRTVQRFNNSFEHVPILQDSLPQTAIDILSMLGSGGVAGEAMAAAGVVKSAVSYWVKRFIAAGVLILKEAQSSETLGKPKKDQHFGPGMPRYYELTPYGSKLLTGSEDRCRLPVVFEDMPVKFSVLQWERFGSIDWEKLGQPRNWVKLGFRVTGVHVVKTSKSIIIHPGPLKGFDVDQLEVDSGRIIERVRFILEVRFEMKFAGDGEFCHGPMWQVFHPDAKVWVKEGGTVRVPGYGALDASPKPSKSGVKDPLNNLPHVEFENKRHAAIAAAWPVASDPLKRNASAAPLYPLYLEEMHRMVVGLVGQVEALTVEVGSVKQFEGQVTEVMKDLKAVAGALGKLENLDKIRESLQTVSGILSQFVDAENSGQVLKGSQENGSGGNAYVS